MMISGEKLRKTNLSHLPSIFNASKNVDIVIITILDKFI